MKPRPWASITSSGRARAEGEEMTAPGSPWTPEEDGLLRSMGAAGESATAIATLLKRKAAGVHQRAHLLEIRLARSPPGPKRKWPSQVTVTLAICSAGLSNFEHTGPQRERFAGPRNYKIVAIASIV